MLGIAILVVAFISFNGLIWVAKAVDKDMDDLRERVRYLEQKIKYNETADKYKV